MILCIETHKYATGKLLELINEFGKVAGYKINTQKSLAFLYTNNKNQQEESNNTLKGSYTMIKWDLSQGFKDSSVYANQSM